MWPVVLLALGLLLPPLLISALIAFVWAWLLRRSAHIVITDTRVVGRWGVLSRADLSQALNNIRAPRVIARRSDWHVDLIQLFQRNRPKRRYFEVPISSVTVERGLFGRLFGYGTIYIYGSGLSVVSIPTIANPARFCRELEDTAQRALGRPHGKAPTSYLTK